MKIEKYKKLKSGKYKVKFDNQREMELYEEAILKYELLLKSDITSKLIIDITTYNDECEVYYSALKLIKTKPRTEKEIRDTLIKKEYPEVFVQKTIDKLKKQKYLDDNFYARGYVHSGINASKGPHKIINELEKKGVAKDITTMALKQYSIEIELEIIEKKIKKMIQSNHTKSNYILKQKILMNLIQQGFHKENIVCLLDRQVFNDDKDIIKKEYNKIYAKLSKKYEGTELEYKVKQKMFQKGIFYED